MANEDKATRYHRLRRRASLAGTGLAAAWLVALLITGWSASLRDLAAGLAGQSFLPTVVCYVVIIAILTEVIQMPLAFYQGVVLERRYELSTQTSWRWCLDQVKATALGLLFGIVGAVIVWGLLRTTPEWWWLAAAVCFVLLVVVLAQLAPVALLPLFYTFTPLDRPALVQRLVALAERAGARVLGVFEWRLSDRTRKANAALAGIGRTRRILLSDTLLAVHSDDEIEVVLAHELAHHVYHDIWKSIALEALLMTAGFYVADRVLGRAVGYFGIVAKQDVAALPVLVLAGGAVSLAMLPLVNALSRAHERRADRYALEMTGNAAAFSSAMKRLGAQNLAEEQPSRLVQILFHSHPPIADRLEAARVWQNTRRA
jgi:STE24 endopeptidase